MQKSLLCLVLAAVCVLALPTEKESLEARTYPRFIDFPDGDGVMHIVDLEAEPDAEVLDEVTRNPANNLYLLYTRRNPQIAQTLTMNNAESITTSNFRASEPTIVIVHGWISNQNSEPNPTVRETYLRKSDVNVITVDWARLAFMDYTTAATGVPAIGRGVGQFLAFLNRVTGAPYSSMHLIGFSLGAHVVGNAGRELAGNVARVTGLDPAGPLWSVSPNRLAPGDGVYVEAIHTDGAAVGGLGIGTNVADVDFYPNGGSYQPGCLVGTRCNHDRAWELFAASVTYNHLVGNRCTSTLQITWDNCTGARFPLGNDDLRKTGAGMYRVNTRSTYPF